MSEPKGPLDAAMGVLKDYAQYSEGRNLRKSCRLAIRVLEDWPRWEPLIKAAGQISNPSILMAALSGWKSMIPKDSWFPADEHDYREIRALVETMPVGGKP
jgi:hypothetical protein